MRFRSSVFGFIRPSTVKTLQGLLSLSMLVIFVLMIYANAVFAERKQYPALAVRACDADSRFPVLREAISKGVLNDLKIPLQYGVCAPYEKTVRNLILVRSAPAILNENPAIMFTLSDVMYGNENMSIDWILPSDKRHDVLRSRVLRGIVGGVVRSEFSGNPSSILDGLMKLDNVDVYRAEFESNDADTRLRGIALDISTKTEHPYRFWLALAEVTCINAVGEIEYLANKGINDDDWEYPFTFKGFARKIADGPTLDANNFTTNAVSHVYAGSMYYSAARSFGYSFPKSMLFSIGGSLMWEYLGEYRERASLNDMLFTGIGGALVGEALFQTARFFERTLPKGILREILILATNPFYFVNRHLFYDESESFRVNVVFYGLPPIR